MSMLFLQMSIDGPTTAKSFATKLTLKSGIVVVQDVGHQISSVSEFQPTMVTNITVRRMHHVHMFMQALSVLESIGTLGADKVPFFRMDVLHVVLQISSLSEGFIALVTGIRSGAAVNSRVYLQTMFCLELLLTFFARILFYSAFTKFRMAVVHVVSPVTVSFVCFVTDFAGEVTFVSVHAELVSLDAHLLREALAAHITDERFVSCVSDHVALQVGRVEELLLAGTTFMGLDPQVTHEMNPRCLPFFTHGATFFISMSV